MKIRTSFLFALLAISFISCGDDENKSLNLNFQLKYEGDPLVFFQEYTYPDGKTIEFTRFSFYLSEIAVSKDGSAQSVTDAKYVDLTQSHSTLDAATGGFDLILDTESTDDYDAVSFNIGLTADQNAGSPEDYPSSSDLSLSGEYWSNWESYVFVKIEARSDLDGDGVSEGIALHLGSDTSMRTVDISNVDSDKSVNISMDLKEVFEQDGEIYDLENNSRIHSLDQMPLIDWLMNSLQNSLEIQQ